MRHPNQATLALHAGGDLGLWARWRTERHLATCERCRDEVAAFAGVREVLPELAEIPEVSWNRLAAEMRANIRLGIAAGECVRSTAAPPRAWPLFTGSRAAVALAGMVVLVVTSLMLEHPSPIASPSTSNEGPLVQATENGIQIRADGRTFRLMNGGAKSVTYTVGADGSMGARYVDPETGYVTINNVYVQ